MLPLSHAQNKMGGENDYSLIQKWNHLYQEKLDGNRKIRLILFGLCFIAIALMMFRLNRLTPWVVDDLLKQQAARNIHSFNELYTLAHNFYLDWGGRVWGEIYAQLFLMIPKKIFDYINTAGYMLFLLLIQWNILGKWKMNPGLLLFIHFSLLLCLPAFGQDILWVSGTANYMWSSLIPLLFLGIWRSYQVQKKNDYNHPIAQAVILLLGVLAGWANENVSVALIFIAFGYSYLYRKQFHKIPQFAYTGTIGLIIGSLALWLAPGNFARFAHEHHSKSILHMLHAAEKNIWALADPSATLLLVVTFVLLCFGIGTIKKRTAINFFIGAFVAAMAFSVIGNLSKDRVFLGITVLLIIAVGILYKQLGTTLKNRKLQCILAIFLLLGSYSFYQQGKSAINDYAFRWNDNVRIIQEEKAQGNMDVFVNPIMPQNKFCAAYGLADIQPQKENQHWLNTGVARYFGIHTIQSVKAEH